MRFVLEDPEYVVFCTMFCRECQCDQGLHDRRPAVNLFIILSFFVHSKFRWDLSGLLFNGTSKLILFFFTKVRKLAAG